MAKIVVAQDLDILPDQLKRLKALGEVKIYNDLAKDYDAWLARVECFGIICSGKLGLRQRYQELHDVFLSLPFVGFGFLDKDILAKNNITVSYSPGCNKDAVSEWIVMMILSLLRNLPHYMNALDLPKGVLPPREIGVSHASVCILGAGNIGSRVGKVCAALDMNVTFFRRGDDLEAAVKDADVVVDALGYNADTDGLLDHDFFASLKPSAYFISITGGDIYDTDALITALDTGKLAGAALDTGNAQIGDGHDPYYRMLAEHPKIIATPHIAAWTKRTSRVSNDMMIDNIEAYLAGKPINLVFEL